jgi:L-erythro-3,5-diaminohexanoate dehydrogenase
VLPADLDPELALMVMDVCGAPALVARLVREYGARGAVPSVLVLGGAGKSGSLSLAAAQDAGAGRRVAVVPDHRQARMLECTGLADQVVIADARSPLGLSGAVEAAGGPADITVVCVDVPGCEQPALCRQPRAERWSSSRWRPTSPQPHWGPRAWLPMCGCWSATGTFPGTRRTP